MSEQTCGGCRWFVGRPLTQVEGHCRKGAPALKRGRYDPVTRITHQPEPEWPPVWSSDFCGKWRPAKPGEVAT